MSGQFIVTRDLLKTAQKACESIDAPNDSEFAAAWNEIEAILSLPSPAMVPMSEVEKLIQVLESYDLDHDLSENEETQISITAEDQMVLRTTIHAFHAKFKV